MSIGLFTPCSREAFRERLETAEIRRKQEEEKLHGRRSSAKDKARREAMRKIEDRQLAKCLGVELEDLE